jgi:S1-C subfamily serine protease
MVDQVLTLLFLPRHAAIICALAVSAILTISPPQAIAEAKPKHQGLTELIESVRPKVVRIEVERKGDRRSDAGTSHCTGFLVSSDGFILTNRHSFLDDDYQTIDFQKATVFLDDGRAFPARANDWPDGRDLFVLKIDAPAPLPYFEFANARALRLGAEVAVLGFPRQYGSLTASVGIVRNISSDGRMFYSDAQSYYGGSGSPIFTTDGSVIGIVHGVYAHNGRGNENASLTYDAGTEAVDLTRSSKNLMSLMDSIRQRLAGK